MRRYGKTGRTLVMGALPALVALCLQGCVVAGAVLVVHLMSSKGYTVAARVNENADTVYSSLVRVAKSRHPDTLKIIKEDAAARQFEAQRTSAAGEEIWYAWKVAPVSRRECELVFSATIGERSGEEVKQEVHRVLNEFFDERGQKWTVVE
jgi:hypothetical protein